MLLLVNVGEKTYEGSLEGKLQGPWLALDPATGEVRSARSGADEPIRLSLAGRHTVILVETRNRER